jgi:hypothetical protein
MDLRTEKHEQEAGESAFSLKIKHSGLILQENAEIPYHTPFQ